MDAITKTAEVLNHPLDRAMVHQKLSDAIDATLLNLTGDDYRDIDTVEHRWEPPFSHHVGRWKQIPRLNALVELGKHTEPENSACASVTLFATKGQTRAEGAPLLGTRGPEVGNSVLVARLLHVAIVALRESHIVSITNDPVNEQLREHYREMGFTNGERLALHEPVSLVTAFEFIGDVYVASGSVSLGAPPP